MPFAAPRPCRTCGVPVTGGAYCAAHLREREQERGTAAQRGYSSAWQRARAGYLRMHPLCIRCHAAGRTELATVVDHIIPHRGDSALMWDSSNWQPLCKPCHDHKTATEDRHHPPRP